MKLCQIDFFLKKKDLGIQLLFMHSATIATILDELHFNYIVLAVYLNGSRRGKLNSFSTPCLAGMFLRENIVVLMGKSIRC